MVNTSRQKKTAKERGRGKSMLFETLKLASAVHKAVRFDLSVYGKYRKADGDSTQGIAVGCTHADPGIPPDIVKRTGPALAVVERGGALTAQHDAGQDGAWQIFGIEDRICVSFLFQRGLTGAQRSVTSNGLMSWERNEYPEQANLFFATDDWAAHAPEIVPVLQGWARLFGRAPLDFSNRERLIVLPQPVDCEASDHVSHALIENIRAGLPLDFTSNAQDPLVLLRQVYKGLGADERKSIRVAVNWIPQIRNADLILRSASPSAKVGYSNVNRDEERLLARVELGKTLAQADLVDIMEAVAGNLGVSTQLLEIGTILADLDGTFPDVRTAFRHDPDFLRLLNDFLDLAIAYRHPDFTKFVRTRFAEAVKFAFMDYPIYGPEFWSAMVENPHTARMVATVLFEAEHRFGDSLSDNLIMLHASSETRDLARRLGEIMIHPSRWDRCQWAGIVTDAHRIRHAKYRISDLLERRLVDTTAVGSARRFVQDNTGLEMPDEASGIGAYQQNAGR